MATHTVPQSHEIFYRTLVELGGAVYRGVQKGDASRGLSALILFDGPSKSTLALKPEEISAERVRREVEAKESEFEKGMGRKNANAGQ
jgi:hypothetical protein